MIELKVPDEAGLIFMSLSKGGYIVKGEKFHSLIRESEDGMVAFCQLFDHTLHISERGYVFLESRNKGRATQKHTQYMVFFSVLFPLFQEKMAGSRRPWHEDICEENIDLEDYNLFSLINNNNLLQAVKLYTLETIQSDLIKKMAEDNILKINHDNTIRFKVPVHRFIDIFEEMSSQDFVLTRDDEEGQDA